MAKILIWFEAAAEPILKNDGLLIAIASASFILAPLLTIANWKWRKRVSEELMY